MVKQSLPKITCMAIVAFIINTLKNIKIKHTLFYIFSDKNIKGSASSSQFRMENGKKEWFE